MLKTKNLGAYRDLLMLFTRYGRKDFKLSLTPDDVMVPEDPKTVIEPDVQQRAKAFAEALKKMGPTYISLARSFPHAPTSSPPNTSWRWSRCRTTWSPFRSPRSSRSWSPN